MKRFFLGVFFCVGAAVLGFAQNYYSYGLTPYGFGSAQMLEYNTTQRSSYAGIQSDFFVGNNFGLLISMGVGFTTSFSVGSNSFPMEHYLGIVTEGLAGLGYYKDLGKLYFLVGGGLGVESTFISPDFQGWDVGFPSYTSLSFGIGVLASGGYRITEKLSVYAGLRGVYGIKELSLYAKDVESPFYITPMIGVGIFRK